MSTSLTIEKASICFRIGLLQWLSDVRFGELLALFQRHPGVTDEITFVTAETHTPLPLATVQARADVLAQRMTQVRQLGYRTGINVLATIGHLNENLAHSLTGDYTRMTDLEGKVGLGSFCPNDERMRKYVRQLYEIVVAADPDYLWIDDDVRLFGHSPIEAGCFCDNCLRLFAQEHGHQHTRESLRAAFNEGSLAAKLELRKAWLQHNRNTLARLLELIERTVHALKPGLPLGFMTGDRFFEGYDFDRWAAILAGPEQAEVMWRPGGGFYDDGWLRGLADKCHAGGRQVAFLPDSVVSIQSEIENFPYQRLHKAAQVTVVEAASQVAAGCTGAAFNVLSIYDEPLTEYEPLVAKLRATRPFLDLMARESGRARPHGLYTGWNKDSFAARNAEQGDWLGPAVAERVSARPDELLEIGLPAAYSPAGAAVTLLWGSTPLALSDDEVQRALAGGVYLDATALEHLNRLGYAEFTGFVVERFVDEDCAEEFTDDPLNSVYAGRRRNGRQAFWPSSAGILTPVAASARSLARAVDYQGDLIGPCCLGVYENGLGGRICVAGYYPWTFLQNLAKSAQMKSVVRWLSRDGLLAYVASFHKINLWVRQTGVGRLVVSLTNSYLDPARDVTLMLRTENDEIRVVDMDCIETTVRAQSTDGVYRAFTLPLIDPWHMRLVLA